MAMKIDQRKIVIDDGKIKRQLSYAIEKSRNYDHLDFEDDEENNETWRIGVWASGRISRLFNYHRLLTKEERAAENRRAAQRFVG